MRCVLALADAASTLTLRSLDDSTRAAGNWDPGQTAKNARRAAQDPATIAYIGDFNVFGFVVDSAT
jgi:hypothetical protein